MDTKIVRPVVEPHKVTSPYGWRVLNGSREYHSGIDYVTRGGDRSVLAIADGVVVHDFDGYDPSRRWDLSAPDSGGNMVILEHELHGVRYFARYLHLVTNRVHVGQRVLRGEAIGVYGDVGYSFGAHLHFDLWMAGWQRVDPTPVLLQGLRAAGII